LGDGIRLNPSVIQHSIITLPKLEIHRINLLYTDKFTPANSCTKAIFYFRPNRKMREDSPHIELEIARGKRPAWKIFELDFNTYTEILRLRKPGTARWVMALGITDYFCYLIVKRMPVSCFMY
jgi:hypothetical protein